MHSKCVNLLNLQHIYVMFTNKWCVVLCVLCSQIGQQAESSIGYADWDMAQRGTSKNRQGREQDDRAEEFKELDSNSTQQEDRAEG